MQSNDVVTVKNIGKRIALVGGAYLYPDETRKCTRGEYDVSRSAGNNLVIVLEEAAPVGQTQPETVLEVPPAEQPDAEVPPAGDESALVSLRETNKKSGTRRSR